MDCLLTLHLTVDRLPNVFLPWDCQRPFRIHLCAVCVFLSNMSPCTRVRLDSSQGLTGSSTASAVCSADYTLQSQSFLKGMPYTLDAMLNMVHRLFSPTHNTREQRTKKCPRVKHVRDAFCCEMQQEQRRSECSFERFCTLCCILSTSNL